MALNVAELETLLGQLTLPDTQVIRNATDVLNKQFLKNPQAVPALVHIMCNSQHPEIRQMAAVLLRKRVAKLWSRLEAGTQAELKRILLESILKEQVNLVRHSIAGVVSAIAKFEVPANRWKELLDFLYQCCSNANPAYREVGMFLLNNLVEPIAEQLRPHFPQLFALFHQSLRDPENVQVRVLTCQCLDDLAGFMTSEEELQMFRQSIPLMIGVIHDCLNQHDEENAIRVFEVFDDLIECEVPVLAKSIPSLTQLFLEIASKKDLEVNTRIKAVNFIYWIIQYKKKSLQKNKLIEPVLTAILPLIAEDKEDPDDEEEQTIAQMAAHTLDLMALQLPPDQVMPQTLKTVELFIQSADPNFNKAAMLILAVIFEGSSEYLKAHLPTLVTICTSGLKNGNQNVREAACLAVEQCSIHLQPEIIEYHAQILPVLFEAMSDQSPRLIEKACMALEAFCENLGKGILPYLHPLMEKLVQMLQFGNLKTQETVICAIGSTAHAASKDFLPYFPKVSEYLRTALSINNPDMLQLRALATDTLGSIAIAVGREAFQPILSDVMTLAVEGLSIEDSYIKECTWSFFSSLAKLFKADFGVFLPVIVPLVFKSCLSEDGLELVNDEEEDVFKDDEDEGEEGGEANISVATSFLHEKEMACLSIGEMFYEVGKDFLPYLQQSLDVLKTMIEYFHPDVREAAVASYTKSLLALHELFDGYKEWETTTTLPVHQDVQQLLAIVMPAIVNLIAEEEERSVVTQICESLTAIIDGIGPVALQGATDEIAKHALALLTKTAVCQTQADDNEDPDEETNMDEEEEAEIDALLIDTVADLIGAMSRVLQGAFQPYFTSFFPHILKYYKSSRPTADRSMAVGCLAEVAAGMKGAIAPFGEELFKLFFKAVSDPDDEVRNNAAYGLGVLCEVTGNESSKHYPQILQKLHEIFVSNQSTSTMDNACGAVARMILTSPNSVPLPQVLPVFFNSLPLKEDFTENTTVFKCIFVLFASQNEYVFSHLPQLFSLFAKVLSGAEGQIKDDTRVALHSLLVSLSAQFADLSNQALASLPETERTVLVNFVSA